MKKIKQKMKALECLQDIPHYKSMGIFSNAQGQLTLQFLVKSGPNSNLSEIVWLSSLPARMKQIRSTVSGGIRPKFELIQAFMAVLVTCKNDFFFIFFLIQFNVPFKIISLIETSQSIGGRNGSTPGKPPDTPASRTWLVSHVASAGLEPTPVTAVR